MSEIAPAAAHPLARHPNHGFWRLDPVPAEDELSAFYESQYYDLLRRTQRAPEIARVAAGGSGAEREREWLGATLYSDVAEVLHRLAPGKRVIDIGAGIGEAAEVLVRNGFVVEGVEPAEDPAAQARARGVTVHTSTIADWARDPAHHGAYDAACLLHVLEHVPDPDATLAAVSTILAPSGLVVIVVPNDFSPLQDAAMRVMGQQRPWWVSAPDHVNYFDMPGLERFLEASGFEPVHRTGDFPMEIFLLMGDDYVGRPELGAVVHERRRRWDLALPAALRRDIQHALASVNVGRNVLVAARKRR